MFDIPALSELSDASIGEMSSPRFSQPLRDFSVQSGHRVCLQCRITGHPIPEAKWYKDNKPIDNSPDFEVKVNLIQQDFVLTVMYTETTDKITGFYIFEVFVIEPDHKIKCLTKYNFFL